MRLAAILIVASCAFGPAFANNYEFVVPVDAARSVADHLAINEDCSSLGETVVRVTAAPAHGTATVKRGTANPHFPTTNPRSACNVRKVPATLVFYKPERGYAGPDSLTIDILYPDGKSRTDTVSITVK